MDSPGCSRGCRHAPVRRRKKKERTTGRVAGKLSHSRRAQMGTTFLRLKNEHIAESQTCRFTTEMHAVPSPASFATSSIAAVESCTTLPALRRYAAAAIEMAEMRPLSQNTLSVCRLKRMHYGISKQHIRGGTPVEVVRQT